MGKLKVLDLFSGIGGFSLGLHRTRGFETAAFCEIDEFCQKVLNKNFPQVPVFNDIKKLNKELLNASGISNIDIVCGGFPCQPFSNAGKKKGRQDDRDLWPEMFRVIEEIKPTWVIGENVAGFIGMEFTRTKVNLESIGYRVQPFIIPACAIGAQHRRDRVWIIAHLDREGVEGFRGTIGNESQHSDMRSNGPQRDASDIDSDGLGRKTNATKKKNDKGIGQSNRRTEAAFDFGNWWTDQSGMGRAIHGFSDRVDRYRRPRVKALGNAIVPGIIEIIGRAILETQKHERI